MLNFFYYYFYYRAAEEEIAALTQIAEKLTTKMAANNSANNTNNNNNSLDNSVPTSGSHSKSNSTGESVDLDNLFAFLSDLQGNTGPPVPQTNGLQNDAALKSRMIEEIAEEMNGLVEDLDEQVMILSKSI